MTLPAKVTFSPYELACELKLWYRKNVAAARRICSNSRGAEFQIFELRGYLVYFTMGGFRDLGVGRANRGEILYYF